MENLLERVSVRQDICHGKPCISGHRIMVEQVLDLVENDVSFDEIIRNYFPSITKEDIHACIHYASALVKNEEVHFAEELYAISM